MPEAASQGAGARPTQADEAAALRKTLQGEAGLPAAAAAGQHPDPASRQPARHEPRADGAPAGRSPVVAVRGGVGPRYGLGRGQRARRFRRSRLAPPGPRCRPAAGSARRASAALRTSRA